MQTQLVIDVTDVGTGTGGHCCGFDCGSASLWLEVVVVLVSSGDLPHPDGEGIWCCGSIGQISQLSHLKSHKSSETPFQVVTP